MQKPPKAIFSWVLACLVLLLVAVPALAQESAKSKGVPPSNRGVSSWSPQTNGTLGSPDATTTIKGDRLKLTEEDIKKLENAEATALDGKPLHHTQPGPQ